MLEFWLCRHGQTEANAKRILSGCVDTPLTIQGIEDAKKLGRLFYEQQLAFDVVVSSDLGRAFRTAAIIASTLGKGSLPIADPLLREMDYGDNNYRDHQTVINETDYFNVDFVHPNGESFRTFQSRIVGRLKMQAAVSHGARIITVTHSGVIRAVNDHFGQHNIFDGKKRRLGHDYVGKYVVDNDCNLVSYDEVCSGLKTGV